MANHIIILWLMTSPGTWEVTLHEYDTHDECHAAVDFLKEFRPDAKPWRRWHEYLLEPSTTGDMMIEDRC